MLCSPGGPALAILLSLLAGCSNSEPSCSASDKVVSYIYIDWNILTRTALSQEDVERAYYADKAELTAEEVCSFTEWLSTKTFSPDYDLSRMNGRYVARVSDGDNSFTLFADQFQICKVEEQICADMTKRDLEFIRDISER